MRTETASGHLNPGTKIESWVGRCGKRCYRSKDDAQSDAHRLVEHTPAFRGKKARAYPCPTCKSWHISTKPRSGRTEWVSVGVAAPLRVNGRQRLGPVGTETSSASTSTGTSGTGRESGHER